MHAHAFCCVCVCVCVCACMQLAGLRAPSRTWTDGSDNLCIWQRSSFRMRGKVHRAATIPASLNASHPRVFSLASFGHAHASLMRLSSRARQPQRANDSNSPQCLANAWTVRSPTPEPFHEQSSDLSDEPQQAAIASKAASLSRQCETSRLLSCGPIRCTRAMMPASRSRVQCERSSCTSFALLAAVIASPRPRSVTREPRRLSSVWPPPRCRRRRR